MKVIKPKVEIFPRMEPFKKIELCGRVCYKSENKIAEGTAERLVGKLIECGHTSVLEHARITAPERLFYLVTQTNKRPYGYSDRVNWISEETNTGTYNHKVWKRVLNARDFIALGGTLEQLKTLEDADDYMTVRFTCDRAIANELVRHRVFSFSQVSTRYVNYKNGIEFIQPLPFEWADLSSGPTEIPDAFADPRYQAWYFACERAEGTYCDLIAEGCKPQEARLVLPLSTATELIMTGTYPQWEAMLNLRMDTAAHPQMRYLMKLMIGQENLPEELKHWREKDGNDQN